MTYDTSLADGFAVAKRRVAEAVDQEARQRIGGDHVELNVRNTQIAEAAQQ